MFTYTGKFSYSAGYASNEEFVFILPANFPKKGDWVFYYSQWSNHVEVGKKAPLTYKTQIIEVEKASNNADAVFSWSDGYRKWTATSKDNLNKLEIHTVSKAGATGNVNAERASESSVSSDTPNYDSSSRVWTGKIDWWEYAVNEPFTVVAPLGVGPDLPILAFWQWTKDAKGVVKAPVKVADTQKSEVKTKEKFSFTTGYYTLQCTVDKHESKIKVRMDNPSKEGKDYELDQAAEFPLRLHGTTPPTPEVEQIEVEARLPQPEPALRRIQSLMPFPSDLVETLTHTASFVDQAGYLAKYAIKQYDDLHQKYHEILNSKKELDTRVHDLEQKVTSNDSEIAQLKADNKSQADQNAALTEKLKQVREEAAKTEKELRDSLQSAQKTIIKEQAHDAEDHKALEEAHKSLNEATTKISELNKKLAETEDKLAANQAQLETLRKRLEDTTKKLTDAKAESSELKSKLDVEVAANAQLTSENAELKQKLTKTTQQLAAAQRALDRANKDLEEVRADNEDKDGIIEDLERGIAATIKDRDSKKKAYDRLKERTDQEIADLEKQLIEVQTAQ